MGEQDKDGLRFPVYRLEYKRDSGVLTHWVQGQVPEKYLAAGTRVTLDVDGENRLTNARLHSAGHLIDVVASKWKPDWIPAKGMHFQTTSWVEFKGALDPSEKDDFKKVFQEEINDLVAEELQMVVKMADQDAGSRRKVGFEGKSDCECGGTHIANSRELTGLSIESLKKAKDCVRVKYSFK